MSSAELLPLLVLLPLTAGALAVMLKPRHAGLLCLLIIAVLSAAWFQLAATLRSQGPLVLEVAAVPTPLGITLQLDAPGLLFLGLSLLVMALATVHTLLDWQRYARSPGFWPSWLLLLTALNVLALSRDLFNIYVGLELLTLAAVALVASAGYTEALRAALRYLLLAMLASLAYLLGVALLYAGTGTLDLTLLGAEPLAEPYAALALGLIVSGLLLKAALFPLHGWLPLAHGSAPGPVSAVLSALVVKAAVVVLWRIWTALDGAALDLHTGGMVLAFLGAAAILWGSLLALRQQRLKRVIAYSTVAQLGYLTLVLAMPSLAAWQGSLMHMLSHGLAKAALFLAAANMMRCLGSDRLSALAGIDARLPISTFAFALASVSLMGLPPSGGFLAKWTLLLAAWEAGLGGLIAVMLLGSLLAAAYLFRVLAQMMSRPSSEVEIHPVSRLAELPALVLAIAALILGFAAAPVFSLMEPASMAELP